MGKESKEEWRYIYIYDIHMIYMIHFVVQQKLTEHCKSTTLQ